VFSINTISVSDSRVSCASSHCLRVVRTCGARRRRRVVRASGSCDIRVLSCIIHTCRVCCSHMCSRVVRTLSCCFARRPRAMSRVSFAHCRVVSRVVNSHCLEALELIKLLIYLIAVSVID
jgi:hypothetical protein